MSDEGKFDGFTGTKFLDSIARLETECSAASIAELPNMGEKAKECYDLLGAALTLSDCAASCYWGCKGGDHRLEFLLGRATSSAYAGLSLAMRGYYDQSLSIARTLGEIANLLVLFIADRKKIDTWKTADERARREAFQPVKVRIALEKLGAPIPVDANRYSKLSTFSIHAIPDALSQSYNPHGQSMTYPTFQQEGFLLALNEIAMPVAFILMCSGALITLDDKRGQVFRDMGRSLLEAVGGVVVTVQGKPWYDLH